MARSRSARAPSSTNITTTGIIDGLALMPTPTNGTNTAIAVQIGSITTARLSSRPRQYQSAGAAELKRRDRKQHDRLDRPGRHVRNRRPVEAEPEHAGEQLHTGVVGQDVRRTPYECHGDIAGERQDHAQPHVEEPRDCRGRRHRKRGSHEVAPQHRQPEPRHRTPEPDPSTLAGFLDEIANRRRSPFGRRHERHQVFRDPIPTHARLPGEPDRAAAADRRAARARRHGRRAR